MRSRGRSIQRSAISETLGAGGECVRDDLGILAAGLAAQTAAPERTRRTLSVSASYVREAKHGPDMSVACRDGCRNTVYALGLLSRERPGNGLE